MRDPPEQRPAGDTRNRPSDGFPSVISGATGAVATRPGGALNPDLVDGVDRSSQPRPTWAGRRGDYARAVARHGGGAARLGIYGNLRHAPSKAGAVPAQPPSHRSRLS